MKDLILDLKQQGKTIIMSSHLLADVQDVCDRIGILHQGELKELGRVDDLLKVSDQTEFRVSGLSEDAKNRIVKTIEEDPGAQLVYSGNPSTTLEDLFLRIIEESEARPGRRVRGSK